MSWAYFSPVQSCMRLDQFQRFENTNHISIAQSLPTTSDFVYHLGLYLEPAAKLVSRISTSDSPLSPPSCVSVRCCKLYLDLNMRELKSLCRSILVHPTNLANGNQRVIPVLCGYGTFPSRLVSVFLHMHVGLGDFRPRSIVTSSQDRLQTSADVCGYLSSPISPREDWRPPIQERVTIGSRAQSHMGIQQARIQLQNNTASKSNFANP